MFICKSKVKKGFTFKAKLGMLTSSLFSTVSYGVIGFLTGREKLSTSHPQLIFHVVSRDLILILLSIKYILLPYD